MVNYSYIGNNFYLLRRYDRRVVTGMDFSLTQWSHDTKNMKQEQSVIRSEQNVANYLISSYK